MVYQRLWAKQYSSLNSDKNDINPKLSIDNSIYLLYQSYGSISGYSNSGGADLILSKINLNGNIDWVNQINYDNSNGFIYNISGNEEYPYVVTKNNNLYIIHRSGSSIYGNIILSKINPINGSIIWSWNNKTISETINNDELPKIALDNYDNIILTYQTNGNVINNVNKGNTDIVLCKINEIDGNIDWYNQYNEINTNYTESNPYVACDINGNIFLSYVTTANIETGNLNSNSSTDIGLIKINNETGNIYWKKFFKELNTINNQSNPSIDIDKTGNVYMVYQTNNSVDPSFNINGNISIVFVKMNNNGKLLWARQKKTFNSLFNNTNPTIIVNDNCDLFFAYQTNGIIIDGINYGGIDIILGKMNNDGNLEWIIQDNLNSYNDDINPSIDIDADNNLYVTYQTSGNINGSINFGEYDIILAKYGIPLIITPENPLITNLKKIKNTTITKKQLQYISNASHMQFINNEIIQDEYNNINLNCKDYAKYININ
jgi:hypothetical protein